MIQLVSAGPDADGWPVTRRRIRPSGTFSARNRPCVSASTVWASLARLDLDLGRTGRHELADERPVRSLAEDVELDREAVGLEPDGADAAARPDVSEHLVVDDGVGEEFGQLGVDSQPRQALAPGVQQRLRDRVDDRGDPPQLSEEQLFGLVHAHRASPNAAS